MPDAAWAVSGIPQADPEGMATLGRVMQKRSNSLIFVAAMFDDQGRYGHQMRNVGYRRALSRLGAMQLVSVMECLVEPLSQQSTLL
jgi:phosphopentomutase